MTDARSAYLEKYDRTLYIQIETLRIRSRFPKFKNEKKLMGREKRRPTEGVGVEGGGVVVCF